jgi:hypothetical protein
MSLGRCGGPRFDADVPDGDGERWGFRDHDANHLMVVEAQSQ